MSCGEYKATKGRVGVTHAHTRTHIVVVRGQLENTESGNGIRERKRTVRAHAHDINEWAGRAIIGRIEICSCNQVYVVHAHCISKRTDRADQHEQ